MFHIIHKRLTPYVSPLPISWMKQSAAWNNGELYGNFDEAAYVPYEEPEDREKKPLYRTFLSQWRAEQLRALALIPPSPLETCFHWNITLPRESKGAENA